LFRQTRNVTNNIFGTDLEQPVHKSSVYSDKNKSTIFDEAPPQQPSNKPDRQRSNIFGANEPIQSAPTRPVSEKFKSNIFGVGDNDTQAKRQGGTRQGLRGRFKQTNNQHSYRPSIAISLYSPLRLTGSLYDEDYQSYAFRSILHIVLLFHTFYLDPNASRSESFVFYIEISPKSNFMFSVNY
jgi:hypothetical protein